MPGGVFAATSRVKMLINKRLRGYGITKNTGLGYPVWYAWEPWTTVGYVAEVYKPDVIVVLAHKPVPMAAAALHTGIPVMIQLQDVDFTNHGGPFETLGSIACVANSHFTAARYRQVYGVDPAVIFPFVALADYVVETSRENVTFINPDEKKGLSIAIEVARLCPAIPFSFIEAWPLTADERADLNRRLRPLPNVTLLPARKDMRSVYEKCRILLAPSVWEEGFGRVATEAQVSGIPVIGSDRGGLPEAIGPGGVILPAEAPAAAWAHAVQRLWDDQQHWRALSEKAVLHASRPEMSVRHKTRTWDALLHTVAGHGPH